MNNPFVETTPELIQEVKDRFGEERAERMMKATNNIRKAFARKAKELQEK